MEGVIIYFSATGNTKFVAEEFKSQFNKNNINCELIDIIYNKEIKKDYEFYVFGSPIHAEMFPEYYLNWIKQNIANVNGNKAIIFSTQASKSGTGMEELRRILKEKGFKVVIQQPIQMPNNYYVVGFSENTPAEKIKLCNEARKKVMEIVKKFLLNEEYISSVKDIRLKIGKISYKIFSRYSRRWASKKLTIDYSKCIGCRKCVEGCPTNNISFNGVISFDTKCISCQKCIHICPVNAFLYKHKQIKQYKLIEQLE